MNFTNALYLGREDGIEADFVKADDDIAVRDSLYTVGRRGVAGRIFVHKIAGAAAGLGKSLSEVKAIAERAVQNTRSIGLALTSCTVPAKGAPTFELGDGNFMTSIPSRTPWQNGNVERSHRNDQLYFYDCKTFRSLDELNGKLADHLIWSNNKTMRVL